MLNVLWIALGGALGSVLRYAVSIAFPLMDNGFPKATLTSNILASFIVGVVSSLIILKFPNTPWLKYFVLIGFCGGFSTFSSFTLELFNLNASSNYGTAVLYTCLSIILGVSAVFLGFWSVKFLSPS